MFKNLLNQKAFESLKIAEFRLFLLARLAAMLGFHIMGTCVGWQIYDLTKDPLSLGFIGLSEAVPYILIALYGGYIADKFNRKYICIISISAYLMCAIALLMYTFNDFYLLHKYGSMAIYFIVFLSGLARGFLGPAMFAFMSQLVPRDQYTNAATWNSTVWQLAAVSGPAIGGLVYGFFGVQAAYILDACLVLTGILLFFPIPSKHIKNQYKQDKLFKSIKTGLDYVFSNQILLGALSLDLFAVLFGGAVALLPIFASQILNAGPEGLGLLRAAPALGAVIMAFFLAFNPPKENAGKWMFLSVAGFGVCTILFAISNIFLLSFALLAIGGAFDNVSVVIRSTILQVMTPDEMRGRVTSVNSIFIGSSNEIGAFESGVAAKLLGLIPSVIFGGSMTIAVVALASKFAPKLKRMQL